MRAINTVLYSRVISVSRCLGVRFGYRFSNSSVVIKVTSGQITGLSFLNMAHAASSVAASARTITFTISRR